jgi:hypothetical protein
LFGHQGLKPKIFRPLNVAAEQAAEKVIHFVIPSEARNLSFFALGQIEERFLASLGMTKSVGYSDR